MAVLRVPVELTWDDDGSPGVNVWHLRTNTSLGGGLDEAVDALHDFYVAVMPLLRGSARAELGEVIDVQTGEGHTPAFTAIQNSAGSNFAPTALQMVISWRTNLRARRGMGRTFIGPLNGGIVDGLGHPSSAALTIVNDASQALIDASSSASIGEWAFGVWGQESAMPGASPELRRAAPHVLRDFTARKVSQEFAVLRSRRD